MRCRGPSDTVTARWPLPNGCGCPRESTFLEPLVSAMTDSVVAAVERTAQAREVRPRRVNEHGTSRPTSLYGFNSEGKGQIIQIIQLIHTLELRIDKLYSRPNISDKYEELTTRHNCSATSPRAECHGLRCGTSLKTQARIERGGVLEVYPTLPETATKIAWRKTCRFEYVLREFTDLTTSCMALHDAHAAQGSVCESACLRTGGTQTASGREERAAPCQEREGSSQAKSLGQCKS